MSSCGRSSSGKPSRCRLAALRASCVSPACPRAHFSSACMPLRADRREQHSRISYVPLTRCPPRRWQEAAVLARRLRAEPALATGLSFVPEGVALSRRLELTGPTSAEVILRSTRPPPTAMGFERLQRTPGLAGKLGYLASELAPSRDTLRRADPLARYGTVGIAAAYLIRPFRLAAQAPRGFRAWRSARRRAGE